MQRPAWSATRCKPSSLMPRAAVGPLHEFANALMRALLPPRISGKVGLAGLAQPPNQRARR